MQGGAKRLCALGGGSDNAAIFRHAFKELGLSAVPFQELCTVDCPLPPYPKYCLHIYPHQITFDLFACTKLLLSPNIEPAKMAEK